MSDALLGVDLGGTKIEIAALARDDGRVLYRERVATPRTGGYDAILAAVAVLVQRADDVLGTRDTPVGLGIPGCLSP
ncbi:MAG: ROK family protein, partial [Aquincola sp.]|nr:ROK family protein [Aquincola sp.]